MDDDAAPDLPRPFVIREGDHRIHDPFSPAKLAQVGEAIGLDETMQVLDLACGSGEMLCTWARDHGTGGTGVDLSSAFVEAAVARSVELGVSDAVRFVRGDAAGYVAEQPVDVAACLGATWIGDGALGTLDLLARSLVPGGVALIGEPFWIRVPDSDDVARRAHAGAVDEWGTLEQLLASFIGHGWDVVQMVLASPDDWDRYVAAQWLSTRRWLDANPGDPLWEEMRADLDASVRDHPVTREHLGWGVFALLAS